MVKRESRQEKLKKRQTTEKRKLCDNNMLGCTEGQPEISHEKLRYMVVKNFIIAYAEKFQIAPDQAVYCIKAEAEKFRCECKPKLPPRSGRKRVESVKPKAIYDNRTLILFFKVLSGGLFLSALALTAVLLVS